MILHPHAMVEAGSTSGTLRAWFVPSDDDESVGTLQGTFQSAGDATPSDPFTFRWQNDAAEMVDLTVRNDVFGLAYAYESQARYNLVVMFHNEDEDDDSNTDARDPSNWHSSDDGRTWTRPGKPRIYFVLDKDALDGPMILQ